MEDLKFLPIKNSAEKAVISAVDGDLLRHEWLFNRNRVVLSITGRKSFHDHYPPLGDKVNPARYLHREIAKRIYGLNTMVEVGKTEVVIHRNGNRLDCTRPNILMVPKGIASLIRTKRNSYTGFKGVFFNYGRYRATITVSGKQVWAESFGSAEEAAHARDEKYKELFGGDDYMLGGLNWPPAWFIEEDFLQSRPKKKINKMKLEIEIPGNLYAILERHIFKDLNIRVDDFISQLLASYGLLAIKNEAEALEEIYTPSADETEAARQALQILLERPSRNWIKGNSVIRKWRNKETGKRKTLPVVTRQELENATKSSLIKSNLDLDIQGGTENQLSSIIEDDEDWL